jgi:hypothetical protein
MTIYKDLKIGSSVNGTSQRYTYNITSSVSSVSGADANGNTLAYDSGFADVYLNGVRLSGADITITSGNSVSFASNLSNGDVVDIVAYGAFTVASVNADNLSSGTVPSARLGTITNFTSTGIDDNATSNAITIDSSENIGIGTSSPTTRLDVDLSGTGETVPIVLSNRNTTAGTGQKTTLGFGLARNSGAFKSQAGTIEVGREQDWTSADTNIDSYMAFSTYLNNAGTEKMRITSAGQLLVGTTDAPSSVDTPLKIHVPITSSGRNALEISQNTTGADKPGAALGLIVDNSGSSTNAAQLSFSTASGGSLSERMRITSGGNVGIGTSSPDGILHLDGGTNTKLVLEKDGSGYASLTFHNDGSSTSYIQLDGSEDMVHYGGSGVNQIFYSGGSERMRITSVGKVQFKRARSNTLGQSCISIEPSDTTVGYGFRLEQTNNDLVVEKSAPSGSELEIARFKVGGGIALGGTGTANTLDDYEEGTWSPAITTDGGGGNSGVTYGDRYGTYTKIGRIVTVHVFCNLDAVSTFGTGNAIISTLPFSSNSASQYRSGVVIGYAKNWNNAPSGGTISTNANKIYLRKRNSTSALSNFTDIVQVGDMNTNSEIILTATYETD